MGLPLTIPAGLPLAFALVMARVAGVFFFLPLPVKDATPALVRAGFTFAAAVALFPYWPTVDAQATTLSMFAMWMLSESAFGLTAGLLVSCLAESLTMTAQLAGLQAGYGYASVIDPTTQADSDVLQVTARLISGLLFFSFGLHAQVMRALAESLLRHPPGQFELTPSLVHMVFTMTANVFTLGLRIAFPILALLLLGEIALALVGRLNSVLQLSFIASPLKMLLTMVTLAALLKVIPPLYREYAEQLLNAFRHS